MKKEHPPGMDKGRLRPKSEYLLQGAQTLWWSAFPQMLFNLNKGFNSNP